MLTLSEKLALAQENVERNCESERREAYLKNALYYGEDIMNLADTVKAKLKDDATHELKMREKRITRIWEKLERSWRTRILEYYELLITEFVALFVMLCIHHGNANRITLISSIIIVLLIAATFYCLCFYKGNMLIRMPRTRALIEELLSNYSDYGRIEATLYFIDYDTNPNVTRVRWIHAPARIDEFESIKSIVEKAEGKRPL